MTENIENENQCECLILRELAEERGGFDLTVQDIPGTTGLIRCQNIGTMNENGHYLCPECAGTCGLIYVPDPENSLYYQKKKKKKKEKKKSKKKGPKVLTKKKSKKVPKILKKPTVKQDKIPPPKKKLKKISLAGINRRTQNVLLLERLRSIIVDQHPTKEDALGNFPEVLRYYNAWMSTAKSGGRYLLNRLNDLSRASRSNPDIFVDWLYDNTTGKDLLEAIPKNYEIQNKLLDFDNGVLLILLSTLETSNEEIIKGLGRLRSNRSQDIILKLRDLTPKLVGEILTSLSSEYNEVDINKKEPPVEFLEQLIKNQNCTSRDCDADQDCFDYGCGPCVDRKILGEDGKIIEVGRCSRPKRAKTGMAYNFVILMQGYYRSLNRFQRGELSQKSMGKITENLKEMFALQEGFDLSLEQAKLLYKGENKFPMINKAIYNKITDSSDESNAGLLKILDDLNKQISDDEESLSLENFPSNFPIIFTPGVEGSERWYGSGGGGVFTDSGDTARYDIILTVIDWKPLNFDNALEPVRDEKPIKKLTSRSYNLFLREIEKLKKQKAKLSEEYSTFLDSVQWKAEDADRSDPEEKIDDIEADEKAREMWEQIDKLDSNIFNLTLRYEKSKIASGSLKTMAEYVLIPENTQNADSLENYFRKFCVDFVRQFMLEFVSMQKRRKIADIENEVLKQLTNDKAEDDFLEDLRKIIKSKTYGSIVPDEKLEIPNKPENMSDEAYKKLEEKLKKENKLQRVIHIIKKSSESFFALINQFVEDELDLFVTTLVENVMQGDNTSIKDVIYRLSDFLVLFSPDLVNLAVFYYGIPGEAFRTKIYMGLINPLEILSASIENKFNILLYDREEDRDKLIGKINGISKDIASVMLINSHKFLDITRRDNYLYMRATGSIRNLFDKSDTESPGSVISPQCLKLADKLPWDQIILYEHNDITKCYNIFDLRSKFISDDKTIPGTDDEFPQDFVNKVVDLNVEKIRQATDAVRSGVMKSVNMMFKKRRRRIRQRKREQQQKTKGDEYIKKFNEIMKCFGVETEKNLLSEIANDFTDTEVDNETTDEETDDETTDEETDGQASSESDFDEQRDDFESDDENFSMGKKDDVQECKICKQEHKLSLTEPAEIRKFVFSNLSKKNDPKAKVKAETAETAHLDDDTSPESKKEEKTEEVSTKSNKNLPTVCDKCKQPLTSRFFYTVVTEKKDPNIFSYKGFHVDCFEEAKLHM